MAESGSLRRARTDDQKVARRRIILKAAERHLVANGFDTFSMAKLGKLAGVAKGTLYLYFRTREEVLLALHLETLGGWTQALIKAVGDGLTDEAFVRAFYTTARAQKVLLPLMSRLDTVIEHNVPLDVLIGAKRTTGGQLETLAADLSESLALTSEAAFDMIRAFGTLLIGASGADLGPRLDRRRLPKDVRRLHAAFSSEALFITNAGRILRSIRAGH